MKILYPDFNTSFPLARAGGHRSGHSLLAAAAATPGVECMAVMPKRGRGAQHPGYDPRVSDFESLGIRSFRQQDGQWHFDCGYPILAVDQTEEVLARVFDTFAPDLVYCQSPKSLPLLKEARRRGTGAVWYLRDRRAEPEDLREALDLGVRLIAVSGFVADQVGAKCGFQAPVLYSLIDEESYRVELADEGFVTLINPHPSKGFELFMGLLALLPEVAFLVVEAWALGPEREKVEERLSAFANVRFLAQLADARELYRQTRVLLVPSVVEEGGPRVVREAQLSGIPVLGSARGGTAELVGDGGIVIDDVENPAAWAAAVRDVTGSPERWRELSARAFRNARREEFRSDAIVRRFLEICRDAAAEA